MCAALYMLDICVLLYVLIVVCAARYAQSLCVALCAHCYMYCSLLYVLLDMFDICVLLYVLIVVCAV